jgi:hypothetical protein
MDKRFRTYGIFIIASAIVWAAVIVGTSAALRGTECYGKIQNILVGGLISHLILIWGPMAAVSNRKSKKPGNQAEP